MKKFSKIISVFLALFMVIGMIPITSLTVFAGHSCPDCQDWIDGEPYCSECYKCQECIDLCIECGVCTDCSGSEICDNCSDEEIGGKMCLECAFDKGTHCPDCESCYYVAGEWCEECGRCYDCIEEIDTACSSYHGMRLCFDCAADTDTHCPGCGQCYNEAEHFCGECGLCSDCAGYDGVCSIIHGTELCYECAADYGGHCPDCGQCYNEAEHFCGECGLCSDCAEIDNACSDELGTEICNECAVEQGLHCSNCFDCYDGGEFCIECGICTACADICSTDELCIDCAISNGYHCPSCETCGDSTIICESCGEKCLDCSNAFCENCNLCDECVLICQGCGSCEDCATICPNCEEYCSECEGLCDDCEFCLVCCEDIARYEGCDCTDYVCPESPDWNEHFNENHTESENTHSIRTSDAWSFDGTYHWHQCVYCDDSTHTTGKANHTYDATGKCTVCYYVKDAKIQIIVQPRDSKNAYVSCPAETPDERNIAHFSVVALGNSELTYTWCRRQYVGGQIKYVPLTSPGQYENYTGPNLAILVPEDACCNEYYYACIITDKEGNEVKTIYVCLTARHDYHYYKSWKTHTRPCNLAERNQYGHVLQCVGTDCEKVTNLRPHKDKNYDGYCDICDYEIGKILITKQPKDVKNALVYNPDEGYDESNIAHFSVEAQGESALTYTWCRKQYVGGQIKYVPLTNPGLYENYTGPNLDILVPEDACCTEYTYACIITDKDGNETRTIDVTLKANHNYQYYEDYNTTRSNPFAESLRKYQGHILVCVSPECGKVTRMRQHVDQNNDLFCDICNSQKDLQYVGITVTAPKEGQLPNYNVISDHIAYYAMGGNSNYTQYRFWFVSDNGVDNWKLIDKNTAFVAGKHYKFIVEMQTKSAYEFPVITRGDGTVELNYWAIVNGDYVTPQKTNNMDPTRYCTIEYEFGMCNDSEIENIVIDNATEPVAGEKPNYSAIVRGSGYYIDTNKNVYYDDWMHNQKLYYIKNGIGWYDVTADDWVYENEYFIAGHEYQIKVYLKTEDGYTFYHSNDLDMLFIASVNGFVASGNTTTSWGLTEQTITASFNCQGKEITTIMVNGLATPKAGENPDYTATTAYPEWYELDSNYGGTGGIIWYDSQGNQLMPTDTFVQGEKYRVEIKIISAKLGGANTSLFTSSVDAYINGNQVVANDTWDMVYGNTNAVYIYYTFPKGAAAPDKWQISVDSTGVYNITPSVSLSGFDKDSITVYDKNNGVVKFNDTKGGWPLVKDLKYYVKLNRSFSNANNLSWNPVKKADTIFPDTSSSGWYNDAVTYAVGAGIMSGYKNGKFGTSDSIQRQDFLVMLARLDGVDLDTYGAKKSAFPDVPEGSYFEAAVNWGSEKGIVTGYQNGKFGVGDKVTREQLVTFLYRYAKYKDYDYSYTSNRETVVSGQYKDFKNVSGFAKDPILWAIEKGVISGKTNTTIVPQGNAQRCEVAKIMYNIFLNDIFK